MENLDLLIRELIQLPTETSWLEFKHNNADPEMIGRDICALANAAAYQDRDVAYLIWGVEDKTHELLGTSFRWRRARKGNEELENWLRHSLSSNANFEYDSVQIDSKWYGVLAVYPAIDRTVMFNKVEYIRIGSYTKPLNDYPQVKADLWNRLRHRDFETQSAKDELTAAQALELLDYPVYFSLQELPIPEGHERILHYLREDALVKKQDNGRYSITNLGAILFAKRLADFPSIVRKALRITQFKGNNNLELLKDYTGNKGYASEFEGLMEFLKAILPSREVIDGALRKTETVYPLVAVREALVNALIHQDLSLRGTGPVMDIYENRLEICNPGLPLVDVRRIIDTPPKSRNEKLAALTRRMRMCEERGSGWDRIVFLCEKQKLPAPRIELYPEPESTRVTLYSHVPFPMLTREEKLHACYFHACLAYVLREPMNNRSLRTRFGLTEKSTSTISRLLKEAVKKKLIRTAEPAPAPRYQRYVPFWA